MVESDPRSGNQRLLVLGAGPAQLGLLEAARARGLWLAVVDRDPAAPGFRFADRRCILSTEDEAGIERLAGALRIGGIISPGTDWPVAIAARLAERLGLPHPITPATAVAATNKLRQREQLAHAGVPQPRSWVVGVDDELPVVTAPVVVKAPDRQGQKGLTLVKDLAGLGAAIGTARSAARNGLALVEELVAGPEVTVVGFSISGVFTALAVTDRITADPPAFGVALAHIYQSPHAEASALVAAGAARALGINDGPSYTQLRIGPRGPQVIEVAARLGGGHDAELVLAATGVDLNSLAIASALDLPIGAPQPTKLIGGAVTRFLVAPSGVFKRVEVPEGLDGVETVRIYREPGYVFTPLRRGSDRAGAVLVLGDDREHAVARAEAAAQRIRFFVGTDGRV